MCLYCCVYCCVCVASCVQVLLDCFSGGVSELVRIDAYLLLRLLALEGSQATVDLLLKQAYLAYVRNAKFYSRTSGTAHETYEASCGGEIGGGKGAWESICC